MIDEKLFENMIKANIDIHKEKQEEECLYICDICGELVDKLVDTYGMLNGNVGKVCEQCIEDYDIGR